jgi:hypothetical protein
VDHAGFLSDPERLSKYDRIAGLVVNRKPQSSRENFFSLDKKPGSWIFLAHAGTIEKQAVGAGALCPSLPRRYAPPPVTGVPEVVL